MTMVQNCQDLLAPKEAMLPQIKKGRERGHECLS